MRSDGLRAAGLLLRRGLAPPNPRDLLLVLLFLAATSAVVVLLQPRYGETVAVMLYLLPVLAAASGLGLQAGVLAAAGAVALLNFLFAEPHFTFLVTDLSDLVTLAVFLLVAGTTGALAGGLREARDAAETRAELVQSLSQSSEALQRAESRDAVLEIAERHLRALSHGPGLALTRKGEALLPETPEGRGLPLAVKDLQAAEQALRRGLPEHAAAPGWNGSVWTFLPVRLEAAEALVLGFQPRALPGPDAEPRAAAIETLVAQCGMALERLALEDQAALESARADSGAQRAALLASLSHDLRTPLAVILGGVTTMLEFPDSLSAAARHQLLESVEQETRRLSHYVDDVLQLTRLGAGAKLRLGWVDPAEAARAALTRLLQLHPGARRVTFDLPPLPMVRAEAALLEQALFNLLDNALRYAEGEVRLGAAISGQRLHLWISDGGGRAPQTDPGKGAGLGLQICTAIAAAFGGSLTLEPLAPQGTRALLDLPLPELGR